MVYTHIPAQPRFGPHGTPPDEQACPAVNSHIPLLGQKPDSQFSSPGVHCEAPGKRHRAPDVVFVHEDPVTQGGPVGVHISPIPTGAT